MLDMRPLCDSQQTTNHHRKVGTGKIRRVAPDLGLLGWLLLKGVSVVIAEGKRPVSFRTRKLSPPAPMVLHSGGCGRVGRRRTQRTVEGRPLRGMALDC